MIPVGPCQLGIFSFCESLGHGHWQGGHGQGSGSCAGLGESGTRGVAALPRLSLAPLLCQDAAEPPPGFVQELPAV